MITIVALILFLVFFQVKPKSLVKTSEALASVPDQPVSVTKSSEPTSNSAVPQSLKPTQPKPVQNSITNLIGVRKASPVETTKDKQISFVKSDVPKPAVDNAGVRRLTTVLLSKPATDVAVSEVKPKQKTVELKTVSVGISSADASKKVSTDVVVSVAAIHEPMDVIDLTEVGIVK